MKRYLLPREGSFYKTALHVHTTVSDGDLTPDEAKALYMEKGYAAVAFTDHDILIPHNELTDDRFVALNGYEVTVKEDGPFLHTGERMHVHHICLIADAPETDFAVMFDPRYVRVGNAASYLPFARYLGEPVMHEYSADYLNRLIETANAHGFLTHYNHPRWSFQNESTLLPLTGLSGIEVASGDGYMGDREPAIFDALLRGGKRLYPIAADDMHETRQLGRYFQMVKAEALTYKALTAALRRGDSYASEGPEIDELSVENRLLFIRTSEARSIALLTDTRAVSVAEAENGVALQSATLRIPKDIAYLRIEVTDKEGRRAYTRAYTPDEFES